MKTTPSPDLFWSTHYVGRWQSNDSGQVGDLHLIGISELPTGGQEGTAESSISAMTGP